MEEQSPAHKRPCIAQLCNLSPNSPLPAANLFRERRCRPQYPNVPVANLDRHGAPDDGPACSLRQRVVVDIYSPLAAPIALGMGATLAWPMHPDIVDDPCRRDA